ncbi:peptidylprolyl isomerase [Streptococcus sp. E17BB]|uniref:peptidylprolyl isomerase n=1 Tax=Streptococcus sp. E17BB TaxID=3278714 RepID=UPI00359EE7AE
MYNKVKIRLMALLGALMLVGFVGMIGFTLGNKITHHQAVKEAEKNASRVLEEKVKENQDKTLSEQNIKDFLIQYYTKKKLGENNHRIKSFMTESAYNKELTEQEKAVNQVNKEFVVDYVFEEATIFINHQTNEAIVEVSYSLTHLSEVTDGQQFKNTHRETDTLKLSYSLASGKLLVSQITPWQLNLSDLSDGGVTYFENQGLSGGSSSSLIPSLEIGQKTE